jgi:diguanylate cyclase (GGDEF)-like protein
MALRGSNGVAQPRLRRLPSARLRDAFDPRTTPAGPRASPVAVAPPGGWIAWAALLVTGALGLAAAVVPGWRSPLIVVADWGSVALVLSGVARHRPDRRTGWFLIALMLTFWACGTVQVQVQGRNTAVTVLAVGLGQAVAVAVTVVLLSASERQRRRRGISLASTFDLLIIATVLSLVAVQLVEVLASSTGDRSFSSLIAPTVDVAVPGLLLRVALTRARPQPSVLFGLAAAGATVTYDLLAQLSGNRLALPGTPDQVLGIVCVLLFGVAAQHRSMTSMFQPRAIVRRPASAALLGLLPVVLVPLGLWEFSHVMHTPGLPTPALLIACCAVAGLCLVRGAHVLHHSEHLADHDPLTDVLNRRGLHDAFTRDPPPLGWSVLLVDIDEFKGVNDAHGHDIGDQLLLVVRDRLVEAAGPDALVGRLGGDEFAVLVDADRAAACAEALLSSLREPVVVNSLQLQVRASIGVAPAEPDRPLTTLLTRADIAMYAAKAAGRDACMIYQPAMHAEVADRFALTNRLRRLLGPGPLPDDEFEVHYQPVVDLASGAAVGAEALVRWRHPDLGLLTPGRFLDLVHLTGLDGRLDELVLGRVVADLAGWRDRGLRTLSISVNVTAASLLDPGFAADVLDRMDRAGLEPELLHLEILEYEKLPESAVVTANLHAVHQRGVALHLDDYGTGFTALDYLWRFPISLLKLDRSVVSSITESSSQLVAGIAAMAHTMGLEVLAEGVETAEQRTRLLQLGITLGQGWLFDPALPEAAFVAAILQEGRQPLGQSVHS